MIKSTNVGSFSKAVVQRTMIIAHSAVTNIANTFPHRWQSVDLKDCWTGGVCSVLHKPSHMIAYRKKSIGQFGQFYMLQCLYVSNFLEKERVLKEKSDTGVICWSHTMTQSMADSILIAFLMEPADLISFFIQVIYNNESLHCLPAACNWRLPPVIQAKPGHSNGGEICFRSIYRREWRVNWLGGLTLTANVWEVYTLDMCTGRTFFCFHLDFLLFCFSGFGSKS